MRSHGCQRRASVSCFVHFVSGPRGSTVSGQHSYAKTSGNTVSRHRAPLWTMTVAPGERCMSSGDFLALRKAVIDPEAFELCVIVAVVLPQHTPRGLSQPRQAGRTRRASEILRASCIVCCPSYVLRSPQPIAPQLVLTRALPTPSIREPKFLYPGKVPEMGRDEF